MKEDAKTVVVDGKIEGFPVIINTKRGYTFEGAKNLERVDLSQTDWESFRYGFYYYFNNSGAKVCNQWIGNYYLKADGEGVWD